MLNNLWDICNRYGVTPEDFEMARQIIGGNSCRMADKVLAPDGEPYLFRWYVVPHNDLGNVYFHIQVKSDPERPLHDHPWDNVSIILSGCYIEILNCNPLGHGWGIGDQRAVVELKRKAGETIFREAHWCHRLLMPEGVPYTMTLFSTGPKIRKWGFWYPEGWIDADEVCQFEGNKSVHVKKGGA